jgi:glycine/D-amino acid oxidase-like deaminating enzyme
MVAIVGGGIIGLSIAWRLAQSAVKVRVLNHGSRGGEASPAAAGMLAPGGEFDRPSVWMQLGMDSHALYAQFVDELGRDSGVQIDYGVCGAVDLGSTAEQREFLRARAERQAAAGIASYETEQGRFYPDAAYVDPGDVLKALRTACLARGVEIEDGRTIAEIDAGPFDALVVAAGAWSGAVAVTSHDRPLRLPRTVPVKGHLTGYSMPPGSLGPIRRNGHTYVLQRASGFTIAGSTEERVGFDTHVEQATCREIHRRAVELWPDLASRTPEKCWIGFRPSAIDLQPHLGRVQGTRVWLAYGHYRNGILLAPVTAERLSRAIISSLGKD